MSEQQTREQLDRGDQDYDPLTRVRMERDALKQEMHALKGSLNRSIQTVLSLQAELDVAWALLRTRDQVDVVEQAIGGTGG